MKKSELRHLIREEISKVLNEDDPISRALVARMGVETTKDYSKNVMRNSPESLPGYRELPDTRADVTDFKKGIKIPSVNAGSVSTLFSKEEVKKWFEEFKTRYKESPQFKIEGTTIKVTNPKYQEALATYAQAVKQFGTKGD